MRKMVKIIDKCYKTKEQILDHIRIELEKDPEYEVFVPLIYYMQRKLRSGIFHPKLKFENHYISNKGRIYSNNSSFNGFNKILAEDGFLKFRITRYKKSHVLDLHQAMASSFIPLEKEYEVNNTTNLQVVCVDHNYGNLSLDNIKWRSSKFTIKPMGITTYEDILTDDELKEYDRSSEFDRLVIVDKVLKERSTGEFFVPLVYKSYDQLKNLPFVFQSINHWISNFGNVLSITDHRKPIFLTKTDCKKRYPTISLRVKGARGSLNAQLHRAMACSFIPTETKEDFDKIPELTVNHKDGDKNNFNLCNLEWATHLENIRHAVNNGLFNTKPVKGTFISGKNLGESFILIGGTEQRNNGFDPSNICNVIKGKRKYHKGCVFSFATEEEVENLPRGVSADSLCTTAARHPTEDDHNYKAS